VVCGDDEWPVRTRDGGRSVHFEHTVAIMEDRVEILTTV
jgi:methionine aminopeptidase